MKKMISKFLNKFPILKYVLKYYLTTIPIVLVVLAAVLAIIVPTGIYGKIESMLDLKYNSLWVLLPLYVSIGLALISFFGGFLAYYYKYKRKINKGKFYREFGLILNPEKNR